MKNKKVLIIISVCIGIILIGSTLAFFNFSISNNNVIGQNSLANIEETIKLEIDETYKKDGLVPIKEEFVTRAAKQECIDDLGNPSCSMYKVKVTNTAEVAQKIHLTLNIEQNTFENYRLLIYKGSRIKEPITDPIILPQNEITQKKLDNISTTLLPEQSVIYNLVYYVNNIYDNTNDINQQFLASITVNTEVSGDYTGTGLGEPDEKVPVQLASGLVPIKYNEENKWEITTISDNNWYNYNEQKWANAAILKNSEDNVVGDELIIPDGDTITESQSNVYAMFVWIPRYEYTIGCLNSDTACYGYRLNDNPDTDPGDPTATLPGAIDIKFVSKDDDLEIPDIDNETYPTYKYTSLDTRDPQNWYTHPAFWWDNNNDGVRAKDNSEELSGIWVGKFETSVDTTSACYTNLKNISTSASTNCAASVSTVTPRILPNVLALTYQTVYNQFNTANKFSIENNIYGIDNTKTDSHMMKNSEWAAVAYLSQSIYGKYGNSTYSGANKEIYKNDSGRYVSSNYWGGYTGRSQGLAPVTSSYTTTGTYKYDVETSGTGASTTGNIYGVYDMSGGAYEHVMGNYGTISNGVFTGTGAGSGITFSDIDIKYYDKFTTTTPSTTISKETIGQAYVETAGWYSDNKGSLSASNPWVNRGGSYYLSTDAGVMDSIYFDGSTSYNTYSFSFRSALAAIES